MDLSNEDHYPWVWNTAFDEEYDIPIWHVPRRVWVQGRKGSEHDGTVVTAGGLIRHKGHFYILTAETFNRKEWRICKAGWDEESRLDRHHQCETILESATTDTRQRFNQRGHGLIGHVVARSVSFGYMLIQVEEYLCRRHRQELESASKELGSIGNSWEKFLATEILVDSEYSDDLGGQPSMGISELLVAVTRRAPIEMKTFDLRSGPWFCSIANLESPGGLGKGIGLVKHGGTVEWTGDRPLHPEDCGSWVFARDFSEPDSHLAPIGVVVGHLDDAVYVMVFDEDACKDMSLEIAMAQYDAEFGRAP